MVSIAQNARHFTPIVITTGSVMDIVFGGLLQHCSCARNGMGVLPEAEVTCVNDNEWQILPIFSTTLAKSLTLLS
jgi:hypothetical protein